MSREHSSVLQDLQGHNGGPPLEDDPRIDGFDVADYWHACIDEKAAAEFYDVTERTMQAWRQKGGGPRFIRLSARCIKYTRALLREHAEARLASNTSEFNSTTSE